jgi:hypothetical protein
MEDISGATLEDPDSTVYHDECSFVIQVLSSDNRNSDHDTSIQDELVLPSESIIRASERKVREAHFGPKPYHLQASSIAERDQWMNTINATLRAYQTKKEEQTRQRGSTLHLCQLRLRSFYTSLPFQTSTALLVAINFFVTVSTSLHTATLPMKETAA